MKQKITMKIGLDVHYRLKIFATRERKNLTEAIDELLKNVECPENS